MVCYNGEKKKRVNKRKPKEIPKTDVNQLCQSHTSDLMRNSHIEKESKGPK